VRVHAIGGVGKRKGLGELFSRLILSENKTNRQIRLILPPSVEMS
jgi:hypothetical protein